MVAGRMGDRKKAGGKEEEARGVLKFWSLQKAVAELYCRSL